MEAHCLAAALAYSLNPTPQIPTELVLPKLTTMSTCSAAIQGILLPASQTIFIHAHAVKPWVC